MTTDDLRFARKVRNILERGTCELDRKVTDRLYESRKKALAHQKGAVGGMRLAGLGHFVTFRWSAYARTLIAAFALLAGVVSTYFWNSYQQAVENAEVDSALLSDELPPAAYLDKGFQTWLERSSQSPQ